MTTENILTVDAGRGTRASQSSLEMYSGDDRPIQCRVWLEPEGDGYSATAPELPGVVSEGETLSDALANFREAFKGALASYRAHREGIPWVGLDAPLRPAPERVLERWVMVCA